MKSLKVSSIAGTWRRICRVRRESLALGVGVGLLASLSEYGLMYRVVARDTASIFWSAGAGDAAGGFLLLLLVS